MLNESLKSLIACVDIQDFRRLKLVDLKKLEKYVDRLRRFAILRTEQFVKVIQI
jgi:hypothetical protein